MGDRYSDATATVDPPDAIAALSAGRWKAMRCPSCVCTISEFCTSAGETTVWIEHEPGCEEGAAMIGKQ